MGNSKNLAIRSAKSLGRYDKFKYIENFQAIFISLYKKQINF